MKVLSETQGRSGPAELSAIDQQWCFTIPFMCWQVGKDMEAQAFLGRLDTDPLIGVAFTQRQLVLCALS